jgi:hypothetical protein
MLIPEVRASKKEQWQCRDTHAHTHTRARARRQDWVTVQCSTVQYKRNEYHGRRQLRRSSRKVRSGSGSSRKYQTRLHAVRNSTIPRSRSSISMIGYGVYVAQQRFPRYVPNLSIRIRLSSVETMKKLHFPYRIIREPETVELMNGSGSNVQPVGGIYQRSPIPPPLPRHLNPIARTRTRLWRGCETCRCIITARIAHLLPIIHRLRLGRRAIEESSAAAAAAAR